MPVPQHRHRDAGRHVEVAAPLDVEQRAALAARHHHGRLAVVVEEQPAPPLDEIVLLRHRQTLPAARPRARQDDAKARRSPAAGQVAGRRSATSRPAAHRRRQSTVRVKNRCLCHGQQRLGWGNHEGGAEHREDGHGRPGPRRDTGRGEGRGCARCSRCRRASSTRRWSCSTTRPSSAATASSRSTELGRPARARRGAAALSRKRDRARQRGSRAEALAGAGRRGARHRPHHHHVVHRHHDPVARRAPLQRARLSLRRAAAADHRRSAASGGAAALARAHDFLVGFPEARVLVVAVELPSLSIQRADVSPANLVSTALFGDGAAAARARGRRLAARRRPRAWRRADPGDAGAPLPELDLRARLRPAR